MLLEDEVARFRDIVYHHYEFHGRDLLWRHTDDPYRVLVSEIMLQQTQVDRVLQKYEEFLAVFPSLQSLVQANLRDVLMVWQGLGYNRRALSLKRLSETVLAEHGGNLPCSQELLSGLPGIGRATAGSILAFAFNAPVVFVETNIRRVFIHHFFQGEADIKDREILPLVEATLDRENPRRWYNALMDYGSMLKGKVENPNRRSAHYTKQSSFTNSDRQIRGRILALLLDGSAVSTEILVEKAGGEGKRVRRILSRLAGEGLIKEEDGCYRIP
jgi:A/G-specific adenine glycosylase